MEGDLSVGELIPRMEKLINQGFQVFVKFNCQYCGSRQTSDTPNTFFTEGYYCEECGRLSKPETFGFAIIGGISK